MQFPDLIQIDCEMFSDKLFLLFESEMFSDKLFLLFETHCGCRKAPANGVA
ncbi:MAG: hypothetical protein NT069_04450 [Planctomycetota bacterium]|nr:hypothetical protein [Planctomycetota bacterium]